MEQEELTASRLMERAAGSTGMDDFGDPAFQDWLDLLTWSLREESDLNERGHRVATAMLQAKLAVRLRVIHAHREYPEIAEQPVEAPIFIIGMPRTGSTFMHHLFGQDRALRVPRRWELHHPWPPPEPATYFSDPRIALHNQEMLSIDDGRPKLAAMHPMRGDFPEECVHLLTPTFASTLYWVLFSVPQYETALPGWDLEPAYRFHRMFLQLLQWRYPASPWVLKYPGHVGHLDVLSKVYPDARFVWLHRDPVASIASVTHLTWLAHTAHQRHTEAAAIAARIARDYADRMRVSMEQRARLETADRPWCDVRYEDFVGDPVQCIQRIYKWAHLDLSDESAKRMQAYVDQPPYPRGGYKNDVQELGVDAAWIREAFKHYTDSFL
ncbi:MAG: sulfotransferase [Myxococcota bacterium]